MAVDRKTSTGERAQDNANQTHPQPNHILTDGSNGQNQTAHDPQLPHTHFERRLSRSIQRKDHDNWFMFYLVRHGETPFNSTGRIQGSMNDPIMQGLNDKGKHQAKQLYNKTLSGTKFDKVFASQKIRAIMTAELSTGVPRDNIVQSANLNERNFGSYEGTSLIKYKEEAAARGLKEMDYVFYSPENCETLCSVQERLLKFIYEELLPAAKPHVNIFAGCHTYNVRELLRFMRDSLDCDFDAFLKPGQNLIGPVPNTSLSVFKMWHENGQITGVECHKLFDVTHITSENSSYRSD